MNAMETYTKETLERARATVANIARLDLSSRSVDEPLNLDSIIRISLIRELENVFEIELPDEAIEPEVFESLASIATLVESRRA